MRQTELPIPNPHEWCGPQTAAKLLGVTRGQLYRIVADRLLTRYHLDGTSVMMLWRAEVDELAAARKRAGATR